MFISKCQSSDPLHSVKSAADATTNRNNVSCQAVSLYSRIDVLRRLFVLFRSSFCAFFLFLSSFFLFYWLNYTIFSNSQPPLQVVVCVSPHKGYITARPKGRYRKLCHWSAIKRYSWNLLFLIPQPALLYISALIHL